MLPSLSQLDNNLDLDRRITSQLYDRRATSREWPAGA
jgi:hypothetical protein